MKKFILFSIAASFLLACSGGDSKNDSTSTVTLPLEVDAGDLTNYVTFPPEIKIKLKDKDKQSSNDKIEVVYTVSYEAKEDFFADYVTFDSYVVDADYVEIARFSIGQFQENGLVDNPKGGDSFSIMSKGIHRIEIRGALEPQDWDNIVKNGAHLIINSSNRFFKEYDNTESSENGANDISSSENETDNVSSPDNTSSVDFDELLDSFERYVDKYISFMKKAKDGDASAMSEYPGLLKEAQDYSKKIQNVKGQLTADQIEKYQRINNKMLKAAQELQ